VSHDRYDGATHERALQDEVLAFIESNKVDRVADYARRGRQHSRLSDDALVAAWKTAFQAMASDPHSAELRAVESDLDSEISLRGLANPIEDVSEAVQTLVSKVSALDQEMKANPEEYASSKAELAKDLEEFRAKRDRHN
jgi:outer membrane murein-binding lipoprotein Lpp